MATIRDSGALAQQWRDLIASGIPLEPPEYRVGLDARSSGGGLTIRSGCDAWRSEIRELKNRSFALSLSVFIRQDLPERTNIREFGIELPWSAGVLLLEPPTGVGRNRSSYSFPRDTDDFAYEAVLNHRLNCVLSRGRVLEGLLLYVGWQLPDTYKNGDKIPIALTLVDQWDNPHTADLEVPIHRLSRRPKAIKKRARVPLLPPGDHDGAILSVEPQRPTVEKREGNVEAMRRSAKEVVSVTSKSAQAKTPIGHKSGAN
jgi:hypothetical protein